MNVYGTTNFTGAMRIATDVWHNSADNANRFYWASGSDTYFNTPSGHGYSFQIGNVTYFNITSTGNLTFYAQQPNLLDSAGQMRFAWLTGNDTYINAAATHYTYFRCGNATIAYIDNVGVFHTYSDRRLKENIVPVTDSLDIVNKLNICSFDFIDNIPQGDKAVKHGLIAQEVLEVYPEAISYSDGFIPTANCIAEAVLVDSSVHITTPVPHQFSGSDTIDLIVGKYRKELPIASIISDTKFTVAVWEKYDATQSVLVFGKKTDDMLGIDKAQIGLLAAGACKILSQQVSTLQSQVTSQQSTITGILARLG